MSEVITRFKLETTQFDSKLRDASKNIASLAKDVRGSAADFDKMAKANLTAAEALGKIATSGTTAKDRVMELVGAFNDAAKAYNKLTDEQKQSDFGKALSESLQTLKTRISETKQELYGMGDAAKGGGLFGGGKLDGMLQVFGGNIMTKAASVVGEFASNMADLVKQGVEMAQQGEGIRIAFERLGRGDILDGLREATHGTVTDLELMKAAVKFNDFKLPVEELGTMLVFAQQKAKDTGQSVDYMVDSIVTGLGRKSLMILDNLGLSASEIKERMKETGDMTKAVGDIIRDQMSKAGDYVETAADKAAQADVNLKNSMEELGRTMQPLTTLGGSMWNDLQVSTLELLNSAMKPLVPVVVELTETIGDFISSVSNSSALSTFNSYLETTFDWATKLIQPLSVVRSVFEYLSSRAPKPVLGAVIGTLAPVKGSSGGGVIPQDPKPPKTKAKEVFGPNTIGAMEQYISELQKKWKAAGDDVRDLYTAQIEHANEVLKQMKGEVPVAGSIAALNEEISKLQKEQQKVTSHEGWEELQRKINNLKFAVKDLKDGMPKGVTFSDAIHRSVLSENEETKTHLNDKNFIGDSMKGLDEKVLTTIAERQAAAAKKVQEAWKQAGTAVGMFGNVLGSLKGPAAQVAATVAQAIASVALAYAQSLAQDKVTKSNIWAFIAASAAAMVSMGTTIAQIHSSTGYASGGVVGGSHYSGDMEYARLNAGETVLTQAQTGIVASALQGGTSDLHLETDVRGDTLRLILRRGNMKRGYGSRSLVL